LRRAIQPPERSGGESLIRSANRTNQNPFFRAIPENFPLIAKKSFSSIAQFE
jgi:hypothetical protein